MREALLHYIWKYQKLTAKNLRISAGGELIIVKSGIHNKHSGPDFFNACIELDGQRWAGNIEIHHKSSDWYKHGHHNDPAYDNVILHVVWEEDRMVFRYSGEPIPTLVLREYVQEEFAGKYQRLVTKAKNRFINCEFFTPHPGAQIPLREKEKLYRERLNLKLDFIMDLFFAYDKDWEKLTFVLLLRNFGQGINTSSFLSLGNAIDYTLVARLKNNPFQLECLFMGMAGLLENCAQPDDHFLTMQREYQFLKLKCHLISESIEKPEFMGVRPSGFPTIRLSQIAALYSRTHKLFHHFVENNDLKLYQELLDVSASDYWSTHYIFGKTSKRRIKRVSRTLVNNIIANTIIPLKRLYSLEYGRDNFEELLALIKNMRAEKNAVLKRFEALGFKNLNALDSQALLYLNKYHCMENRCLECTIGKQILN